MQALAAAMRKLQEEWWVLVVQLEHQLKLGQLNLAALLYYCQAPSASLALLANVAVRGCNADAGQGMGREGREGRVVSTRKQLRTDLCQAVATPQIGSGGDDSAIN